MTLAINKRRLVFGVLGLGLVVLAVGVIARVTLTEMAVGSLLRMAGASEVQFSVAQASPWRVVFEDIAFAFKTQPFSARRISVARSHWYQPSLGVVRVEEARMPITIDGSDREPTAYKNAAVASPSSSVPIDEVYVDGQVIIRAADVADQALTVKLEARMTPQRTWSGQVKVAGPGLGLNGQVAYDLAQDQLDFDFPQISLDLKPWQAFAQRMIVLPGGSWTLEGKLQGRAAGRLAGKALTAHGSVQFREGRARYDEKDITAEGIEADFEFTDFEKMVSRPGRLRVAAVRIGTFSLTDLAAELELQGTEKIVVSALSLRALGGRASTEPFKLFPSQREIDAVVQVEDLSVEEIMSLTKDLPAKASGRVNGHFPVRIDDSGVRLGTGWLELKPGVYAELQLEATGLLTGGMAPKSPSYAVLKQVESGLLKLQIHELRLDIRPPNAPPGRSAQIHLSGSPVDPNVKAPVTLDLNVNGPLEQLLNLGLDSRLKFGTK